MAKDVLITPASSTVEFKDTGVLKATIKEDLGNLILDPENGIIVLGDGTPTNIEFGDAATSVTLDLLGGGDISSSGNALNIGLAGDTINLNVTGVTYNYPTSLARTADVTASLSTKMNTSGGVFTGNVYINGNSSDTVPILSLRSGNSSTTTNDGAQIRFGYNGNDTYAGFIHTRHNAVNTNNTIEFYVSDGTANNTVTIGSVHCMSLNSGKVGIAGILNPSKVLEVNGEIQGTYLISTATTGTVPLQVTSTTLCTNLNADRLDSLHATSFLRSDAANSSDVIFDTVSGRGLRFWNSEQYKIHMSAATDATYGGRIAGETTSDYNMYFRIGYGTNRGFVFESVVGTKLLSINPDGVRSNVGLTVSGTVTATDVNSTSDKRLKENIQPINSALDTINKINPVKFQWKKDKVEAYGVIAQELEELLPQLVSTDASGIKSVSYTQLIPIIIKAIQELSNASSN